MTSTSMDELSKLPSQLLLKLEIIWEAQELQQYFTSYNLPLQKDSKQVWLRCLCQLREDYFAEFPEFVDELKMQIDSSFSEAMDTANKAI